MIKFENNKYYSLVILSLLLSLLTQAQNNGNDQARKAMDFFNKGAEMATNGKYAEAIADFDKAISLDKTSYEFFYNRGYCEVHMDDNEAAVSDFTEAIKLRGKIYPDALYYRGYCYNHLKMYELAISDLSKALSVHSNSDLWSARAFAYMQTKNYGNAISDYTNAITLNSKDIEFLGLRALCHFELHQQKEALEDADKFLAVKPSSPDIIEMEIKAKSELKDNQGAYESAKKLLKLKKTPVSYYYMGMTEFYTQKYKEAINDFSIVLKMNPKYRDAYYCRALCYFGINDNDNGCQDLSSASALGYPGLKDKVETYCKKKTQVPEK